MGAPPVARITAVLGEPINSSTMGMVGSSMIWIAPSGAPALTAASARARTASTLHSRAAGCGLITMALRVINEIRIL